MNIGERMSRLAQCPGEPAVLCCDCGGCEMRRVRGYVDTGEAVEGACISAHWFCCIVVDRVRSLDLTSNQLSGSFPSVVSGLGALQ